MLFRLGVLSLKSIAKQGPVSLRSMQTLARFLNWNPAPDNTVNALVATNGIVYASGSFTNTGGLSRNRIVALDATTGVPTGWNPNADNTVWSMVLAGNQLIVAGPFTHIGGQQRYQLAGLDIGTGNATAFNPAPLGQVNTLAAYGNTV